MNFYALFRQVPVFFTLNKTDIEDLKFFTENINIVVVVVQSILTTNGFHFSPKGNLSRSKSIRPKITKKIKFN